MKIHRTFVVLLLSFFCACAFAQTSTAAYELAKLLSNYKTYTANFKQATYSSSGGGRRQQSSGKLYMQRPGKFRWEVNAPDQQIIVANGRTLWIYDVVLQQVTKEKINRQSTNNPAILLSGHVGELIKQYRVSKIQFHGKIWYQLIPRFSPSNFTLIRMYFLKGHLKTVWVKNNLGQISIFQFSNIRLNTSLKATLFHFKPPTGVDVLQ